MKVVTMLFPRTSSVYSSTIHAGASASRIAALGALLLTCAVCSGQDALARLIPPDAPVIAGMQPSSTDNSYDRVWLATAKNLNDLKEFISLTDTGASRRFDRVIVTASPLGNDLLGNHLLIAEGLFDLSVMNQTIAPAINEFHGIPIAVVTLPSSSGAETLWLANLHNRIVLFGSPSAVQEALLRYQSGKPADPAVRARLNRIPRKDVAWSSITLNPLILKSHLRLNGYQRNLVPCLTTVSEFALGIRFDSDARIDLHLVANTPLDARTSIACLNHLADHADLVAIRSRVSANASIGAMSVVSARDEYSRWVDTFRHHTDDLLLAAAVPY
jgi:hypothetical protein